MTPWNERRDADIVGKCNCMIRNETSHWLPCRRDGDKFYDAAGCLLWAPKEWRDATPQECADYLAQDNATMVNMLGVVS